jgi:hypothetical protein
MTAVDESVELYAGSIEAVGGGQHATGQGKVVLSWVPTPSVVFSLDIVEGNFDPVIADEVSLKLEGYGNAIAAQITGISNDIGPGRSSCRLSGIVSNGEGRTALADFSHVDFALANFVNFRGNWITNLSGHNSWAGRSVLQFDNWKLTIDKVEPERLKPNSKAALAAGFLITHSARLERRDGALFSVEEAKLVLDVLYWFFSFCRAKPTPAVLPQGFDSNGNPVWSEWANLNLAPLADERSWFNSLNSEGVEGLIQGFWSKFNDPAWKKAVKLAVYWYLESNAVGNDSALILAQAAFELLTWNMLVKSGPRISRSEFKDRNTAESRLGMALSAAKIPDKVPDTLTALLRLANVEGWSNGPASLVNVRNALVHTSRDSHEECLDELDAHSLFEACALSLWYLELLLLSLFDYQGQYSSRLIFSGFRGSEVSSVPWKK